MARKTFSRDWDDDAEDGDYDEGYEDETSNDWKDIDDDPEADSVTCPNCHALIFEDATLCPHCNEYVTQSTNPWLGRPGWWVALGFLGIIAVILAMSQF